MPKLSVLLCSLLHNLFGGSMTTSMTMQKQARALVIGNYRGRCGVVDALQVLEFRVWEATAWIQGLKHILEMCPKPSQNSSFKAITYVRSVAEGGIWGQVQEAHSLIS